MRNIILWRRVQRIGDGRWLDGNWEFTDDEDMAADYTLDRADAHDTVNEVATNLGEGCRVIVRYRKTNRPKTTAGQRAFEVFYKYNGRPRWAHCHPSVQADWERAARAAIMDRG